MSDIQLECQVTSQPQANVHWFRHGIPVLTSHRINRQDNALIGNFTDTQYVLRSKHLMFIKSIRESDFGVYTCRSENVIGTSSCNVEVTGRPMKPSFKRAPPASNLMTHNLIWQTESLSPIYEYKLQFRQVPSGDITPSNRYRPDMEWNELIVPAYDSEGLISHKTVAAFVHRSLFDAFFLCSFLRSIS